MHLFPLFLFIVPLIRESVDRVHSHIYHPLRLLVDPLLRQSVRNITVHCETEKNKISEMKKEFKEILACSSKL